MSPLIVLLLILLGGAAGKAWHARRRLAAAEERHRRELQETQARYEAAVREQAQRLETLLGRMIEGLVVVDVAGRIRLANRAAAALFDFSPPMADRPLVEVARHHEVAAILARLEHEPEVRGQELRLEGAAPRILQVNAVRLHNARGEREGALLVFHDLTQLRKLEALRQEFVANVSHELRTPLSLIKGAAETLIDGGKNDPEALARFLEIIDRHSSRLALLIEDLLLLSALDSGRIELQVQSVPLRAAVQEVLEDFSPAARERRVALDNEVPAALTARADAGRLRQVLSNLVDNAIKHGRENGRVQVGGAALSGGWVQLVVRDDGPGIPPEAQERVFERFFRVDKARARSQGGTGLGLAIVKHLVQAHGGEMRVESAENRGAAFYFKLPAEN